MGIALIVCCAFLLMIALLNPAEGEAGEFRVSGRLGLAVIVLTVLQVTGML
jgi:hypothetical protein